MSCRVAFTNLLPPERVCGLTKLTDVERTLFSKSVLVPCLQIKSNLVGLVSQHEAVRCYTIEKQSNKLKFGLIWSVEKMSFSQGFFQHKMAIWDLPGTSGEKYILFDPEKMNDETKNIISDVVGRITGVVPQFHRFNFNVTYSDWSAKTCINAVLPPGLVFSGFTQAGHIIHVNLREELLPYKYAVGQILRDKISSCRTVVNKLELIENEFRTFQIDHLAGDVDYITTVNVDRMLFKIDFSKTFWNTRLTTEHRRIWSQFDKSSMIFDCCAGVGPFVLPAARLHVHSIYANDLNPDCLYYLKENIIANKLAKVPNFHIFNMDAIDFIRSVVAETLALTTSHSDIRAISCLNTNKEKHGVALEELDMSVSSTYISNVHVLMNLPAKSLSFLPHFRGLLSCKRFPFKHRADLPFPIIIHCHFFVKADDDVPNQWYADEGISLIRTNVGTDEIKVRDVHFVRKVAGRKWMMCVSFEFPSFLLFDSSLSSDSLLILTNAETSDYQIHGSKIRKADVTSQTEEAQGRYIVVDKLQKGGELRKHLIKKRQQCGVVGLRDEIESIERRPKKGKT